MGLRCIVYIDDGICASTSRAECLVAKQTLLLDLDRAGFVLNIDKCLLEPVQKGRWLGFILDIGSGSYFVPDAKLKACLSTLELGSRVHVRTLSSIVGQAIDPVARLRMRALYSVINARFTWSERLVLSEDAIGELKFWKECLPTYNGQAIWFESEATRLAYSDASSTSYGGYVVEIGNHGHWSPDEKDMSTTWRELRAVYGVLLAFANKLRCHTVKWFKDNHAVRIVQVGSKKEHLQEGAMCIFQACLEHGVRLEMEWIPRGQNETANYISLSLLILMIGKLIPQFSRRLIFCGSTYC